MAINVDMDSIEEKAGNAPQQLPNGPYVLKVVSVDFRPRTDSGYEQTWMDLVWDVAEGEFADAMADRPDWTHTAQVSFEKSRLGFTKHILNCISRSNGTRADGQPEFNATAAWQCVCDPEDKYRDRAIEAFKGKLFGGNVVTYHRQNKGRNARRYPDSTTQRVWTFYDADEVRKGTDRDGKAIVALSDQWAKGWTPELAKGQQPEQQQTAAPVVSDSDIPF